MTVVALRYSEESVGKRVAGTKVRYSWDFSIDRIHCQVVMLASYWSSKRVLTFDGRLMFQGLKPFRRAFTYTFGAKGHLFRIEEDNKSVEIFVDDTPFKLMALQASSILRDDDEAEQQEEAPWTPPLLEQRRSRLDQILHLMLQPDFLEIDDMPSRKKKLKPKVAKDFNEIEIYTDSLKFASSSTRQRFINASTFNRGRSPVRNEYVHREIEDTPRQEPSRSNWKAARRVRHSSVPSQNVDLLGFDTELTTIRHHDRKPSPSPEAKNFMSHTMVEEVKVVPTPLQKSLLYKEHSEGYKNFRIAPRLARRSSVSSLDMFNTSPDIFAMPAYSPKATPRTKIDFEATFNTVY
mmetsp:Transcript_7991/g.15699  ORF Transcript_7991/g.15699 Transcript_7991/m.15699 type:complete len:350 (-) Transcript_7991:8161-9210(-)